MVFSSGIFLFLFFPMFLMAYAILPYKNFVIVAFSLVFYFAGEGIYTLLILVSVAINYGFGLLIGRQVDARARHVAVSAGVACNIAILGFFKYLGFFSTIATASSQPAWIASIHMPIGISFFTFHSISYLVDIYRRKAHAEHSLTDLAVYLLMFPQLIAGPIIRYSTIAAQLRRRVVRLRHVYFGVVFFAIGLAQKVLLADTFAGIADPLFSAWKALSPGATWIATVAYTLQIFFDFNGYSNMAIGLGLLCGFRFPRNFNYPYISQSITEFWKRWHMTLSRWFRDYVYIPLGGNRHGPVRTYINLFAVFLLCGLWHGAAWTFVLWGIYHGLLLVAERMGLRNLLSLFPAVVRHFYTLLAIMVGWVLFRSNSLDQAMGMLGAMFAVGAVPDAPLKQFVSAADLLLLAAGAVFATPLPLRFLGRPMGLSTMVLLIPRPVFSNVYVAGSMASVFLIALSGAKIITGSYSPFIYFRF